MASFFGNNLKLTIYGTSHGPEIGMYLEGIPAGFSVDMPALQAFLNRRAPGRESWSTARKEADVPHFLSGFTDGKTNGETIHGVIYNENVRKSDYQELKYIPRPGHADYTAWVKYGLDFDMSGGGPFSGRMTAPMCIAGGLCRQWLEAKGIRIGAHILCLSDTGTNTHCDVRFDDMQPQIDQVRSDFPTISANVARQMQETIERMKAKGDSVGGLIECAAVGVPAGVGEALFGGVESQLSAILYAIPAVKELRFGHDAVTTNMTGSIYNDEYLLRDGKVVFGSNCAGGILGGITTGMPILFQIGLKPTPSIAMPQRSVNLKTMEEVRIQIRGRHDPCILPRAVPVVEAATAIALYDLLSKHP